MLHQKWLITSRLCFKKATVLHWITEEVWCAVSRNCQKLQVPARRFHRCKLISLKFNLINVPLPWAKRQRTLLRHAWSCLTEFYGTCYQRMGLNHWRITSHELMKSHASQTTKLPTLWPGLRMYTELRFGTGRQSQGGGGWGGAFAVTMWFCMGSRASVIIRIILCCLVDITALLVSLCIRQCLIDPVFGMWRGFKISCMEKHPENVARQEVDFDFRHLGYFMIFRNGTTLAQQRHFEIHDCSTHLRHNCSSHLLNFTKKQWQRQKITKRHTTLFHKRSTALLLSLVCGCATVFGCRTGRVAKYLD